jgi:outer membrane protein, adhesin transport system
MVVKLIVPAALALVAIVPMPTGAAPPVAAIPPASATPLVDDPAGDPILSLGRTSGAADSFRRIIAAAVARHPALAEARAGEDEARAARGEARAGQLPSGSVTFSNYQVLTRAFSNDPVNIIERSRARRRSDASLTLQQPVWDFGATADRIAAANARMRAAEAQTQDTADQVALRAIASWYDVYAYRALVSLGGTFAENQRQLRIAVQARIGQGVAAPGDLAQVDSYIGSADRRLAAFTRQLANAEARYDQLVGTPAPQTMLRAPFVAQPLASKDFAMAAAARAPAVTAAEAAARAAREDARAVRATNLPQVSVGIDAGRYGVFENPRDYDVRANVTVRQRLFGGTVSRENQAEARARAGVARSDRVREEATRDAAIAWSDVQALETELGALETSYVASRRSRDVLVERFRASRGTLFDVLSAEDNLFQAATAYVQTLTELDTARYVLLSRSGRLLDALEIETLPESRKP